MRTHNIPPCYRKIKEILIMPSDLALLSTLIGSNSSCLELIFMVPKVFKPLKFDCTYYSKNNLICLAQSQACNLSIPMFDPGFKSG